MDECKSCGKDIDRQGTHWDGCHTSHPECAAFQAGREAGMREAAKRCDELWRKWYAKYGGNTAFDAAYTTALQNASSDILAAIGGGK